MQSQLFKFFTQFMMELVFKIKPFNELSSIELYNVLRLRSEVFVVEQNCPYQDIDNKDFIAIHILGYMNDNLVAYCRLFDQGQYFDEASIGRVIVNSLYRKNKFGYLLMEKAISTITELYNTNCITISAQQYLTKFYQTLGFIQTSEMYLEDNIPHIQMELKT